MLADFDNLVRAMDVPVDRYGDQPAIWFEGRSLRFAQIDRRANRLAAALIAAGLEPGDSVATLTRNHPDFVTVLFATLKARGCLVPVNWRLADPEIIAILRDSDARLLFCESRFEDRSAGFVRDCDGLHRLFTFDDAGKSASLDHAIDGLPDDGAFLGGPRDEGALQLYTSGTTGLPKGVRLSHHNLLSFYDSAIASGWADWKAGKTALLTFPLFHVAGFNLNMLAWLQGVRSVLVADAEPGTIVDLIDSQRINYASMVPAVLDSVLRASDGRAVDFTSMEKISYGGSPITEDLLRRALARFACAFSQLYGMTETGGGATELPPEAHVPERLRSCGRPLPGIEMRIVDAAGQPCPPGRHGEIQIRTPSMIRAYWRRPDVPMLTADGWFATGDAGYVDEAGFYFLCDRIKDMIITGGENVYPAEVESALADHPDIDDVAVIGVPDPRWGEAVKAFVVRRAGAETDAAAIIAWARGRIAGFKLPKAIAFIDALPRNGTGKVMRRALRDRAPS